MKLPDAQSILLRKRWLAVACTLLWPAVLNFPVSICQGQGTLTPPGAPGPSMKSLDQVEPRIPVDAAHTPGNSTNVFNISQPGSYYLTTNIVISSGSAIGINVSGVTLDLRGFTISSTNAAALNGINLYGAAVQDITIQNGHIQGGVNYSLGSFSGTGFQNGIACATPFGSNPRNLRVADVTLSGMRLAAVNIGKYSSTAVVRCNVQAINGTGITAGEVNDCAVDSCSGTAISCLSAANSSATCVGSSTALLANSAMNCVGISSTGTGINATTANGCYGQCSGFAGTGNGIQALTANNCYGSADSSSGHGITADVVTACRGFSAAGNGINGNTVSSSYGVSAGAGTYGIYAYYNAHNSYGFANAGSWGFYAYNANTCYGYNYGPGSGTGLAAVTAANCTGYAAGTNSTGIAGYGPLQACWGHTSGGTCSSAGCAGISATYNGCTLAFCYGENVLPNAPFTLGSGPGLAGSIIIGCSGLGTPNVTYATAKYLMP